MKKLYLIRIEKPLWKGYTYGLYYTKNYGDYWGGCREFETKKKMIAYIKELIKECLDSIANRNGDKATKDNHNSRYFWG